jgi:menaquinol-cytochrome c reductase cytochrome b/c subunit
VPQDRPQRQRRAGAILRTLENPTAPMPSFAGLPEEKKTAMVDFLSQLRGE